jgi:hypothetical protein
MSRTGRGSAGTPSRLRTFDPVRLADLEYRAWVGYYLRRWPQVLIALVRLVRTGFGMDWYRTLYGAWLLLRSQACMRRFYTLVSITYGVPANPAKAAELEVDWWRVHREGQHRDGSHAIDDAEPAEELVQSLTRLYSYLYGEPESSFGPAAVHRARAMDLSDEWIRQGCQPASRLLPLEHAELVRCYAALLAAVHQPRPWEG